MYRLLFDIPIHYYMKMKNVSPKIRGKIQLMFAQYESLNVKISTLHYCRKQGNPENIFPHIIADLILVLIYDDWTFMPMICDLDSTHLRWISIDFILQLVLLFPSLMPFRYDTKYSYIYSTTYNFGTHSITILWHHTSMKWSMITIEWKC